jgi:hypothetical protein
MKDRSLASQNPVEAVVWICMRFLKPLILTFLLQSGVIGKEPLLRESFQDGLSKDWFWGLGTWKAENGILHGFESGPRRHGPVTMRRLALQDAVIECEFRLVGKATFAGIIFNGSQERGHVVHLVMARDHLRILAHPRKGETLELARLPTTLAPQAWHKVKLSFQGTSVSVLVNGQSLSAEHGCLAEEKQTFGLGGDSGGPEGEQAGALEFRSLVITGP